MTPGTENQQPQIAQQLDAAKAVLGSTGTPPAPKIPYVLYYRSGNNPSPQTKHFTLPTAEMHKVIERARRHCDIVGCRFVQVRPFWTDLDQEEKAMMRGEQSS